MFASRGVLGSTHRASVLAGAYAWAMTVALPMSHRLVPGAARAAGACALGALLGGAIARRRRPLLGTVLGIWGFLACSGVAWWLGRAALLGYRLDPAVGALGSIGWLAYAMTWVIAPPAEAALGASPAAASAPETGLDDSEREGQPGPRGSALRPRLRLARSSIVLVAAGCSAALLVLLAAFFIPDRARGIVGQGVALASAAWIALVVFRLAGDLESVPARERGGAARQVRRALGRARWPLLVVFATAVVGAAAAWLR